jgi:polysaccharide pyruvyl transferase WcaK-like protein
MSAAPPRIALFGLFGAGNFGNEGSLAALHQALRGALPAGAELSCICAEPAKVLAQHGLASIPINRPPFRARWARILDRVLLGMPSRLANLAHTFAALRGLDALIAPGTGLLDDFGEGPTGMPYDVFRWCLLARLRGLKVVLVSIGAGPVRNRWSRLLLALAARLANRRSYRDLASKEFVVGLGVEVRDDVVTPDLAFLLPRPSPPAPSSSAAVIGVGVMAYRGWLPDPDAEARIYAAYRDTMTAFVAGLLRSGRRVRLLIGEDYDAATAEEIAAAAAAAVPDAPPPEVPPLATLSDVMAAMADADVVVATRFHNVVCALKMGKPTISLGYAPKNDALLEAAGLGGYALHVERFTLSELQERLEALLAERDALRAAVIARTSAYENELAAELDRVIGALGLSR